MMAVGCGRGHCSFKVLLFLRLIALVGELIALYGDLFACFVP
jgi:hypothetical protein